jgi:hypothetical protein
METLKQQQYRPARYTDFIYGDLKKLNLPSSIIDKSIGKLILDSYALNILIVLYSIQRSQAIKRKYNPFPPACKSNHATVKTNRDTIVKMTGIHKNRIAQGIQTLVDYRYISVSKYRGEYQQYSSTEYILLNPRTGEPLIEGPGSLLHANKLHYFPIPVCMLTRHSVSKPNTYSFALMTLQEKRVYVTLAWKAKQDKTPEIYLSSKELRDITGLEERALKKALEGLNTRHMVWNSSATTMKSMNIVLRNPITEELLSETRFSAIARHDPRNYYMADTKGNSKRADFRMPADIARALYLKLMSEKGEHPLQEGSNEYKSRCPFHNGSSQNCNFNPVDGCFHCFSTKCGEKGTTRYLFDKLTGNSEETIKRIAQAMGKQIEFKSPDSDAIAIYDWIDEHGVRKFQELRFPNDENGNKVIQKRRPGKDGWIYTGNKLAPMLYNANLIQYADTVFITEGAKDADTIMKTGLRSYHGSEVIGTTSGSANSWHPKLAKKLKDKRVVILPDDDAAGKLYADAIEQSLIAENIEYRRVNFEGTGAKDVTEFLEEHGNEKDLVRLVGVDWLRLKDYTEVTDPNAVIISSDEDNEVTI